MAGNIIPAIATTNAITAGIVALCAMKVLREQFDRCQSVYVRLRVNARNQILVPDKSMLNNEQTFIIGYRLLTVIIII